MKKLNHLPKKVRCTLLGVDLIHVAILIGTVVAANMATPGHLIIAVLGVCTLGWTVFAGWIHGLLNP